MAVKKLSKQVGRANSIIGRFPHFYRSEEYFNLFFQFIEAFGKACDEAEEDILHVMHSHWVDTADNANTNGQTFGQKGDIDKIFSLYIESLGVTSLLQQGKRSENGQGKLQDEVYRTRIKGLINVLRSGASPKSGIIKVVAANLGILDDQPEAEEARKTIKIIEFLPEQETLPTSLVTLYEPMLISNPNVVSSDADYRISLSDKLHLPLTDPTLINLTTGDFVRYVGTLKPGDTLHFFPNNITLRNGETVVAEGKLPVLLPGDSRFRLEAKVGLQDGVFDEGIFDFSIFATDGIEAVAIFDQPGAVFDIAAFDFAGQVTNQVARFDVPSVYFDIAVFPFPEPVGTLEVTLTRLHPASFTVRIPWDIPGFTVNFKASTYAIGKMEQQGLPMELLQKLALVENQELTSKGEFFKKTGLTKEVIEPFASLIWDNLEYPDKFRELPVNPRSQIKPIVDKVKAAGVYAVVDYLKMFRETHDHNAQLSSWQVGGTQEVHLVEESYFGLASVQTPYPGGVSHNLSDSLVLSGMFDYTGFETLNTFA